VTWNQQGHRRLLEEYICRGDSVASATIAHARLMRGFQPGRQKLRSSGLFPCPVYIKPFAASLR
jgi:hypothetical protein